VTDNPIKFGTDGWRGIIAQDFTFDNVRSCAQAVAEYLKQSGLAHRGLIVGYDTRFASEDFASATAEVAAGNGIKVSPAKWSGFKYKSEIGSSASSEVTAQIEKNIALILGTGEVNRIPQAEALDKGLIEYLDLAPTYFDHLTSLIDLNGLRRAKLKVVVDPMYGAGIGYFKTLLGNGAAELIEINSERNPLFSGIQPEPIAANLDKLSATVTRRKADVGVAIDGDADRLGIVDENGVFLTPLQVFALLALYLLEIRSERGPIVKTITTTNMLYRLGEIFGVPVHETPVGFKYVAPMMIAENALIGGEESGGYGFRGHMPERDGILAGLYFLDLMVKTGKSPSQLIDYLYNKVGPHHFKRIDVEFPEDKRQAIIDRIEHNPPQSIEGVKVVNLDTRDGFRFTLADNTWLLIRFSGTEPVLRLYTESDSPARVEKLLERGREIAGV